MRTIIVLGALLTAGAAHAHGGGLDGQGCHTNRKTGDYHCHRAQAPAAPADSSALVGDRQPSRPQPSSGPTCYTGPRGGTYTITPSGRKNYAGC
jgi:hypothetical protein